MPSFQSPVPINGRPCLPTARLWSSARAQCSNRVALLVRNGRLEIGVVLAGLQRVALEKRRELVQHRDVAGRIDIVRGAPGEPDLVVGDTGAHALAGWRQPPMLHVAFDELTRRGAQQVLARECRLRQRERHAVLQLVAETVGAARLVERRARPHAAGERLVEQPAVEHDIHGTVGRFHLDRAEHFVPEPDDRIQDGVEIGSSGNARSRIAHRPSWPPRRGRRRSPRCRPAPSSTAV